jgi:hypothetical protein
MDGSRTRPLFEAHCSPACPTNAYRRFSAMAPAIQDHDRPVAALRPYRLHDQPDPERLAEIAACEQRASAANDPALGRLAKTAEGAGYAGECLLSLVSLTE